MSPTLLFFLWQLLGPNDPIIVSRETTYVTAPLKPNGLPDYEQFELQEQRRGITSDNNAAVLLWQAMWPGDLEPRQYQPMCDELGLDRVPSDSETFRSVDDRQFQERLKSWLAAHVDSTGSKVSVDELLVQVKRQPWTTQQMPLLADWLQDNKQPLDTIVKASLRSRYYSPSPSLIDGKRGMLIDVLLPGVQSVRAATNGLAIRAMWHLGENRTADAWLDVLAIYRLSRLVGQSPTLVEKLAGISIGDTAHECAVTTMGQQNVPIEQVELALRDLRSLGNNSDLTKGLEFDRLLLLDSLIWMHSGDLRNEPSAPLLAADWNVALRSANDWHDRIIEAASISTFVDRQEALEAIEQEIRSVEEPKGRRRDFRVILNRAVRSETYSAIFISLMLPATNKLMNSLDQANTRLELSRVAAALAVYHAKHGSYPEQLDQLVPDVIPKLPVDLFHEKPFSYQRDADGYLLYTCGPNGRDDGGSGQFSNKRPIDSLPKSEQAAAQEKISTGADDISLRVPTPPFKLSTPPAHP